MTERHEPLLELLLLTEQELAAARQKVQELAYLKWEAAGSPDDDALSAKFWKEAEQQWIEYYYVPDR